jgi:hypothetical protein
MRWMLEIALEVGFLSRNLNHSRARVPVMVFATEPVLRLHLQPAFEVSARHEAAYLAVPGLIAPAPASRNPSAASEFHRCIVPSMQGGR